MITVEPHMHSSVTTLYKNGGVLFSEAYSLSKGQHRGRMTTNGDTPYGVYRESWHAGGFGRKISVAYGTAKLTLAGLSGEAKDSGRTGIAIHGGGTPLVTQGLDPYNVNQKLVPTHGCTRLHNYDANLLLFWVALLKTAGDPLGNIYVGDPNHLQAMAETKDRHGNYSYPDLREDLGLDWHRSVAAAGTGGAIDAIVGSIVSAPPPLLERPKTRTIEK